MTHQQAGKLPIFVVITIYIIILSTLFPYSVNASVSEAFTYQGKIVNDDGTNLTNTDAACINTGGADTCDLRISLFTASSGGSPVWQETKSNVEIYDNHGIINTVLDCGGTFSTCNQNGGPDFTSGQLYIQVEFDPNGNGDFAEGETFNPRRLMTAVPYAFNAKTADTAANATSASNAELLDSIDSASFLRSDTSDTYDAGNQLDFNGTLDVNGDIIVSDTALSFDGVSTEFTIAGDLSINGDDLYVDKATGYIGVNNSDPSVHFDVTGNFRATQNADIEGTTAIGNGSALSSNSGLIIDYDATYTTVGQQLLIKGAVTGAANTNVFGMQLDPESITIPAGTTNLAASLYIDEPNITETGTLTNSASLYILGAASEANNNYSLWADSGAVRFDDALIMNGNIFVGGSDANSSNIIISNDGSMAINEQGMNSDFRIDGSGANATAVLFMDASERSIGINTSAPTAFLDIPASTQPRASLTIRSGAQPATPNVGDIYADGTDIFYRNSSGWVDLTDTGGVTSLQTAYTNGSSIAVDGGALAFDLVSANFDIEVGGGSDTGDFRIWDGTKNWFFMDEASNTISLGNNTAGTALALTGGTTWSIASTGAVAGLTTLSSSGDWTWSASSPTISINSDETFTISDGTQSFSVNASANSFGMVSGSDSITFDMDSGPVYAGGARPTKTITLSPEYPGAVLTPFYGAGTDGSISGTMISDSDTAPASSIRTFYSWERGAATQHYYTVAVRVQLPADFSEWALNNAVVVNYQTENALNTNCDVDVRIYQEGSGTLEASSVDKTSTSWAQVAFARGDLDLWNAAGETAVIYLRLSSQGGYYSRVGDIVLTYLAKY